jgi:beta-phosphoglucomutase family hydrolase
MRSARRDEVRGFIFDMDGVIVDSNPLHRIAWEEYNRRWGLAATEAMQRRMYGKRNDEIVRDFFGSGLTEDEVFAHGARKEELYREMMTGRLEDALVPGIRDFLERYPAVPAAVATNAEPANVSFVLGRSGLAARFQAVVDGHQVRDPKPAPEIFLTAADRLGIDPRFCVVFEDSFAGVQAGLSAGMRVVGITTTHDELPGASLLVRDFRDKALDVWLHASALA